MAALADGRSGYKGVSLIQTDIPEQGMDAKTDGRVAHKPRVEDDILVLVKLIQSQVRLGPLAAGDFVAVVGEPAALLAFLIKENQARKSDFLETVRPLKRLAFERISFTVPSGS